MKNPTRQLRDLASEHVRAWLLDYRKWLLVELVIVILAVGGAFGSHDLGTAFGVFAFWQLSITAAYLLYVGTSFPFVWLTGKQVHGNPARAVLAGLPTYMLASQLQRTLLSDLLRLDITWWDRLIALMRYSIVGALVILLCVLIGRGSAVRLRPSATMKPGTRPDNAVIEAEVSASSAVETRHGHMHDAPRHDDGSIPLYIASEDHHVKIVYPDRIEIARSSLKNEIARWAGHGMQVHRSYWLREKAIATRHRRGRQLVFELIDGVEIPVGRSFEKSVIEFCDISRRLMRETPDNGQKDQGSAS